MATDNASAAATLTLNDDEQRRTWQHIQFRPCVSEHGNCVSQQQRSGRPAYFAVASDALGADGGAGTADGTTAQYAQAYITADAPLTFCALLSAGQSRKTTIAALAVAGDQRAALYRVRHRHHGDCGGRVSRIRWISASLAQTHYTLRVFLHGRCRGRAHGRYFAHHLRADQSL